MIRIARPQRWPHMRVPDFILQCVAYVAHPLRSSGSDEIYDCEGTGFFISVPSEADPNDIYCHFVMARHTLEAFHQGSIAVLVNKKGGGVGVLGGAATGFLEHPTDKTVDAVVLLFNADPSLDIKTIPISMFIDQQKMEEERIGIGDEVFMPGLLTIAPGQTRNIPMLRHGNIAMFPDGPIQVDEGFAEVYLIEARSIGGISGSPVFVRGTTVITGTDHKGKQISVHGISNRHYLLGLMHGHWDIKETEKNQYQVRHDRLRGVNMGIGVVVPAQKILEIINHPILVDLRKERDRAARAAKIPGPD